MPSTLVRTRTTVIAALMVKRGQADAMLCGVDGRYTRHLRHVRDIIGLRRGVQAPSALTVLVLRKGAFFLCDTHVTAEPTAEGIAEMTLLAAEAMRRFGIEPKAALLSHSSFGASDEPSARKMRAALALVLAAEPDLEVEGEMQAELAISPELRERLFPNSRLTGPANLLVMPDHGCRQYRPRPAAPAGGGDVHRAHPDGRGAAGAYRDARRSRCAAWST